MRAYIGQRRATTRDVRWIDPIDDGHVGQRCLRGGWRDAGEDHRHDVLAGVTRLQAVATGRRRTPVVMSMGASRPVRMSRRAVTVLRVVVPLVHVHVLQRHRPRAQQCRQCEERRDDANHRRECMGGGVQRQTSASHAAATRIRLTTPQQPLLEERFLPARALQRPDEFDA